MNSPLCRHHQFIDHNDKAQGYYEAVRRYVLDNRILVDLFRQKQMLNYGLAGVFVNPESLINTFIPKPNKTSSLKRTAFYRTHLSEINFITIATSLAEGIGISTIARIQCVHKKTVLTTLSKSLLKNLITTECQLDEMWSFIMKKEKNLSDIEKLHGQFGDAWIWIAFDAVNKIFINVVVGKRTTPYAIKLLENVKNITKQMPSLFSSDQLPQYKTALLSVYGKAILSKDKSSQSQKSRLFPPKDLLYVQVVKEYEKNRISNITKKIIFGSQKQVDEMLEKSVVSNKINTAFVERSNGIIRHLDARCNRKTLRFSKLNENHEHQLKLSIAYYHICRPHKTLTKRYSRPTSPFMAAGLTDHVWSMSELLSCGVPEDGK